MTDLCPWVAFALAAIATGVATALARSFLIDESERMVAAALDRLNADLRRILGVP